MAPVAAARRSSAPTSARRPRSTRAATRSTLAGATDGWRRAATAPTPATRVAAADLDQLTGSRPRNPISPGSTGTRYFWTNTLGTIYRRRPRPIGSTPIGMRRRPPAARAVSSNGVPRRNGRRGAVSSRGRALRPVRVESACVIPADKSHHVALVHRHSLRSALVAASASTWVHYQILNDPTYASFCDVNATFNCTDAYTSRFGAFGGVPVALFGLLFFAGVLVLDRAVLAVEDRGGRIFPVMSSPRRRSAWPWSCISPTRRISFSTSVCLLCAGTYVAVIGLFLHLRSGHQGIP